MKRNNFIIKLIGTNVQLIEYCESILKLFIYFLIVFYLNNMKYYFYNILLIIYNIFIFIKRVYNLKILNSNEIHFNWIDFFDIQLKYFMNIIYFFILYNIKEINFKEILKKIILFDIKNDEKW